jgi:hypothetical protein
MINFEVAFISRLIVNARTIHNMNFDNIIFNNQKISIIFINLNKNIVICKEKKYSSNLLYEILIETCIIHIRKCNK